MRVRMETTDLGGVIDSMRRLGKAGPEAAMRRLSAMVQAVAARARELCPDDPDTPGTDLADSIRATKATRSRGGMISAAVIAGGARLRKRLGKRAYNIIAVVQHEDTTLKHTRGQAKFVEQPYLQVVPTVAGDLQEALDQEAARVVG